MSTTLTIAVNTSANDVEYTESGSTWEIISTANDYLVFSNGSTEVADGEDLPTQSELSSAGVVLNGTEQIVPYYFLADVGDNVLRQIDLMGNTTNQYVMAFVFDGATATEPVLELWDDENLNTITSTTLGGGNAANSWWRGITTTTAPGSASWVGTHLAGSGSGYYLNLNDGNGALSVATTLYCNLKIVIPSTATTGASVTPKIVVKFTSN
jgi:hypothetical protein